MASDVILWLAVLLAISVTINVLLVRREFGRLRNAYWRAGR